MEPERMQCMEVWGGNGKTQRCFKMPGLRSWVHSVPHELADSGGDLFYVSSCASGRITRMLLADVSGHGAAVSEIALGLRDLMRKNVNMIKQDRFVDAMNRQFTSISSSRTFATAVVSTYFAPRRTLAICNAGHPCPLLIRHREQRWQMIQREQSETAEITNVPLGIIEESAYSHHKITLEVGDMVLYYSDALTESSLADGGQLGEQGLVVLANQLDPAPELFIPRLMQTIGCEHEENLQQDDVTAILVQVQNTKPRLQDTLAAPVRLLKRAEFNDQLD